MTRSDSLLGNMLFQLRSEDPSVRCSAVESLFNESLTDEMVEDVCALVEDRDKGVGNTVDLMLSINPSPQIPVHLIKYVSSPNISARNLAGEILLKIGGNSVAAMLAYIPDGSNDDKKFIVDILGLIGDRRSAPEILELLKINKNENVVMACIEALGNLKCVESLDFMILIYDDNELFKPTIIEALGKIGTEMALNFIVSRFGEEDDLTKFSMIESLGLVGNEDSFYFLISELNRTSGPLVWPIIESIFSLKEKYHLDVPFDEKMKNSILQTIEEADSKYKKSAVNLIIPFAGDDIALACLKIYGEDYETDEMIKPKILAGQAKFFELFIMLLNSECKNLKNLLELSTEILTVQGFKYKEFLSDLQLRNFTDAVIGSLDSPDEEIRKLATELLFILDKENAILFLDKMIGDDNMWNKLKLLEILSGIYNHEAEDAIIRLTSDPEEMISDRAKFILSQRSDIQFESK